MNQIQTAAAGTLKQNPSQETKEEEGEGGEEEEKGKKNK